MRSSRYKGGVEGTSIIMESIVEFIVGLGGWLVDCILTLCGKKKFNYWNFHVCYLATQILVGLSY